MSFNFDFDPFFLLLAFLDKTHFEKAVSFKDVLSVHFLKLFFRKDSQSVILFRTKKSYPKVFGRKWQTLEWMPCYKW